MPLSVAVLMDPIRSIKIAKDTTFALLLEASRRGHALLYMEQGVLALRGGEAMVHHIIIGLGIASCVLLCAAYGGGATYAIPIVYMPILMITHVAAFVLLARPAPKAAAQARPLGAAA